MQYDIVVVGAGAAGLTAAIFAGRAAPGARIAAVDGAPKIGAKILIAGGGRCNVTHDEVLPEDFNGNRNSIAKVLRTFPVAETIAFFEEIGVTLKREETGKLFPVTDRARTVLDALVNAAEKAGVNILPATRVESVASGFQLETSRGVIRTPKMVLATGGRSVPKTGSDGHGYSLAHALGHTVTEVFPALVPLLLGAGHWMRELSGVSTDVELSVRSGTGRMLARQRGAMLMTHFGISGPAPLDISRHWIDARRNDRGATLICNFLPGEDFESVERHFLAGAKRNPHATEGSLLRGRLPERVLERLSDATPLSRLTREARRELIRSLTEFPISVAGDRGFDYAEVTAGGVPLSEVDVGTMASRRCRGLYLCGEILDVDGRIGGYNFQWAWASGRLAGMHCAR